MSHILIVDDDPDIHSFIKNELRNSAYEIHSAFSSEEAIDELQKREFSMAFVDIVLGDSTTSEKVIQFMKQEHAGKNQYLPMAIMSSFMDEKYALKVKKKGPSVFASICKPFKKNQLINLLNGSGQRSVLVYDSDPKNLCRIKNELNEYDYQVFASFNLDQAKHLLENTSFFAAFVDTNIKEQKIKEFTEFLARSSEEYKLPLILMSDNIKEDLNYKENVSIHDVIQRPTKEGQALTILDALKLWHEDSNGHNNAQVLKAQKNIENEDDIEVVRAYADENEEDHRISDVTESIDQDKIKVYGDELDDNGDFTLESVTQNLEEELNRVGGYYDKVEDEVTTISSDDFNDLSSTHLDGEFEDIGEPLHKIKGNKEVIKDEKWHVKSSNKNSDAPLMLKKAFDPNKRNAHGITPIMACAYMGNINKVKDLISKGAKVDLKTKSGKSLLHFAAASGNSELIDFLIKKYRLRVNERDEAGREPLYEAIKSSSFETFKCLLEFGARYNIKINGRSYLMVATQVGNIEIVKELFELGLDPKSADYNGRTSIDIAKKNARLDLINLFKQK